jgi:hypothetical protein
MQQNLKFLEDKLKELDKKIAEVNKRMPAHSAKPPIMMELFALEDEREEVFRKLQQIKNAETNKS